MPAVPVPMEWWNFLHPKLSSQKGAYYNPYPKIGFLEGPILLFIMGWNSSWTRFFLSFLLLFFWEFGGKWAHFLKKICLGSVFGCGFWVSVCNITISTYVYSLLSHITFIISLWAQSNVHFISFSWLLLLWTASDQCFIFVVYMYYLYIVLYIEIFILNNPI